jgi:hypothetical protein
MNFKRAFCFDHRVEDVVSAANPISREKTLSDAVSYGHRILPGLFALIP